MFTTASSLNGLNVPHFETRKALIIINLQKDSFYHQGDIFLCRNRDFVDGIKNLVPPFRNVGDIVWIRTEISPPPSTSPTASSAAREGSVKKDRPETEHLETSEDQMEGDSAEGELERESWQSGRDQRVTEGDTQIYQPRSLVSSMEMRASASAMADKRPGHTTVLIDDKKTSELTLPAVYVAGTTGVEVPEDLKELVDDEKDMIVTKKYYSAFDQTSLLMSLRMRLVTKIYICGCLTNIAVYATAADAVQHGFDVNIVEDCLGYRSEDKHEEAMRQMADVLGVDGIDSEELIEEAGGGAPPDAEEAMFAGPGIEGIGLGDSPLADDQLNVAALSNAPDSKNAETIKGSTYERNIRSESVRPNMNTPPSAAQVQRDLSPAMPVFEKEANSVLVEPSARTLSPCNVRASVQNSQEHRSTETPQTLEVRKYLGAGDSQVLHDVLGPPLNENAFQVLREEVKWQVMHHRGGEVPRLVAVQGQIGEEGSIPIYRHPADESPLLLPFSSTVEQVRKEVERVVKQPLNHVLIQLYRDGNDNISEHSDKTLDIVRGSNIIDVSLGAQRLMTLRTKKPKRAFNATVAEEQRQVQRITLPHNSAFILGPQTNAQWLHGVRADKRPELQKADEEMSYGGERISLTFRDIGTFMSARRKRIWGQGARSKVKATAGKIRHDDPAEMEAMIIAFGNENHRPDFDWDAEYGRGFDVVNLTNDTNRQ